MLKSERAEQNNQPRWAWLAKIVTSGLLALSITIVAMVGWPSLPRAMAVPPTPLVRCNASVTDVTADANFTVDLYVDNVVDLYGADLWVSYPTPLLEVVDSDSGTSGVQIAPVSTFLAADWVIVNDTQPGKISYAVSQLGTLHPNPVSGSGSLARITLHPLDEGSASLVFTYQKLARRDSTAIPATTQACTINISFTGVPTAVHVTDLRAWSYAGGWLPWSWPW
jgi:hypothetical protein